MQIIGELERVENGTSIEQIYPALASGAGTQFDFTTDEGNYTLIVAINYEAERLYYKVKDYAGSLIVKFNTLIEKVNLIAGLVEGYQLQFRNNKFYFGFIEEDLDALLQANNQ